MPFKSEKQRRFMFSQHPDIAKRWAAEAAKDPRKKDGKPPRRAKRKR